MNISVRYRVSEEFYENAEKAGLYSPMITRCEQILDQYLKTDKETEQSKPKKALGQGFDEILRKELDAVNEEKNREPVRHDTTPS